LVTPLFAECTWLDFAVISLVAGVGEESIFRGVLQYGLVSWVGAVGAIVIAAAVFGLVHWVTPMYAFYATLMGLYLGWLFVWFDNLLVPMMVHGLYDFVALVYVTGESTAAGHADLPRSDQGEADDSAPPPPDGGNNHE
jgi:membrane protease YdiL (CAAX protease family)